MGLSGAEARNISGTPGLGLSNPDIDHVLKQTYHSKQISFTEGHI